MVLGEEAIAPDVWNQFVSTLGWSMPAGATWRWNARGINGLANAVILAEPNSAFIRTWLASYASFNAAHWAEHCCEVPLRLAISEPQWLVTLSTRSFFLPQFEQLQDFFTKDEWPFQHNWLVHLWHHLSEQPFLNKYARGFEDVIWQDETRSSTSFVRLARAILGILPPGINREDWLQRRVLPPAPDSTQ
jgi:hypothetical protein